MYCGVTTMQKSEVQKLEAELKKSGITADALREKFRSTRRSEVKLACALYGYFEVSHEAEYLGYLKSRLRPALTELLLAGRVRELAELEALDLITEKLTEECLQAAIAAGAQDAIVYFLQLKARHYGFRDRDFTL